MEEITEKIIASAFAVSNILGSGFLEKVYEKALLIELKEIGLFVESQKPMPVNYKGHLVGDYYADLLIEKSIIIELKSVKQIDNQHIAQILNYLKASNLHLGLIINFGNPKVEIKRVVNGY